jgi:uncharacterized protein (TIGR00730 family)
MNENGKEYETGDEVADQLIDQLVGRTGYAETRSLVKQIITSAVKLGRESNDLGDLKLANSTLKELRYSFKVFAPYRAFKKVIMFGSARSKPNDAEYAMAENFSRAMSEKGYMIVTGGGPGVMEAGNKGAVRGNDFALNIRLPYEQNANPYISHKERLINFKYFFTRKLVFVKETDATALFPGGMGTLDEGFEMLTLVQTGKSRPRPIVLMEPEDSGYWSDFIDFLNRQLVKNSFISPGDVSLFTRAGSVEAAVSAIEGFYRVYHSLRYDGAMTVIRLNRRISDATLQLANADFGDILLDGEIRPSSPTEKEVLHNEFLHLPRLSMSFNRHSYDRLYELIRLINRDEPPIRPNC